MTLAAPTVPSTPRRVKVYELRNNDWFDRGTGYCTGEMVNVSWGVVSHSVLCEGVRALMGWLG